MAATVGLGSRGQRPGEVLQQGGVVDHVGVRHRLHLLDVGAGGEDLLAAPDDDRRDVAALGRLAARRDQAVLDLAVERVHRRAVEADRADAVLDLEAHEVGHGVPPAARVALGVRVDARAPAGARCARRTGSPGSTTCSIVRQVGTRGDEVLADDDEGRAGDAGLDAVHVEVELVAGLVAGAAGRRAGRPGSATGRRRA